MVVMVVRARFLNIRALLPLLTAVVVAAVLAKAESATAEGNPAAAPSSPHPASDYEKRFRREWPNPLAKSVHVWENVFSTSDLNSVAIEARKLSSWALGGDQLLQGKRATCWMDDARQPPGGGGSGGGGSPSSPRPLIEEYVRMLARTVMQRYGVGISDGHKGSGNWLGWVGRVVCLFGCCLLSWSLSSSLPSNCSPRECHLSSVSLVCLYPLLSLFLSPTVGTVRNAPRDGLFG